MRLLLAGGDPADVHSSPGHPERPDRVRAAVAGVEFLGLGDDLVRLAPRTATRAELERVHPASHLELLAGATGMLDPDTYLRRGSWEAATAAAGAGLAAIDALAGGQGDVAFVAVRPPGHHALAESAMGFCLVNNVAVAAAALAERGERVAIVDWDVHHGNGTQAIFYDDPRVLFVSTHEAPPFYPGSGLATETGGVAASGLTVNVPLPAGATGDVVRSALDTVAAQAVEAFAPTWVLVSAGFDAHRADPLADLALSAGDYADLARTVASFAPQPGRLALFLEGGYDLEAVRDSVAASLGALVGAPVATEAPTSGGPGMEAVAVAGRLHASLH